MTLLARLSVMAMARWGLLWLIVMGVVGCRSGSGSAPAERPLPRLSDLAHSDQTPGAAAYDHGVVAVASIVRIWLPASVSMATLWQDFAQHALSDAELEQWQANELDAAVLNRVDIPAFLQRLPANYGVRQQMLTLAYELAPLEPASSRYAQQQVMVKILGGEEPTGKGQLQFLIAADAQGGDWVKVTLVPHLYQPKVTIQARPHTEAALDGRIYSELMLRALLAPGKVLLVAPVIQEQAFDDTPAPAEQGAVAATQPAEAPDQPLELPAVSTQPVRPTLGKALMTGAFGHASRQQLLIIETQRVHSSREASRK